MAALYSGEAMISKKHSVYVFTLIFSDLALISGTVFLPIISSVKKGISVGLTPVRGYRLKLASTSWSIESQAPVSKLLLVHGHWSLHMALSTNGSY